MLPTSKSSRQKSPFPVVPGILLLAFLLVASIWAATYFSAEARVRRASERVVSLVEKSGEESAVSLGLAANRLGESMAADAVLELGDYGAVATGRQEIVQLFTQIRVSLDVIAFEHPEISVVKAGKSAVNAHVTARYRLAPPAGEAAEGQGTAELNWIKGDEGWKIMHATLHTEEGATLPGGWK